MSSEKESNLADENQQEKDAAVESEIKKTQNSIELQTKALDKLRTIKTGKRKILDILRQNSEIMDKRLMAQLNDRYNEFMLQEAEILEILKFSIGMSKTGTDTEEGSGPDPETRQIMSEIAEVKSQLARLSAKNVQLEKEAASKDLGVATKQRDMLSKKVYEIQQNNVQKKQLLNKLVLENPEFLEKDSKKGSKKPDLDAYMHAVQNTPGTSQEFDEISRRVEQIKLRQNRMNNLRERLAQASTTQTMDDTYHAALNRLENLSAIRKVLEETSEETTNMEGETEPAACSAGEDASQNPRRTLTSTTSVQLVNDSVDEEDDELVDEVRRAFLSQMTVPNVSLINHTLSTFADNFNSQFKRVFDTLEVQNRRITQLYDQINLLVTLVGQQSNSVIALKQKLLDAPTDVLNELSFILSNLAAGNRTSLESLDSVLCRLELEDKNPQSTKNAGINLKNAEHVAALNGGGRGDFERKIVPGFVPNFAENVLPGKSSDDSSTLEKEICLIIEAIIPWLNSNENKIATIELLSELRQLVIDTSGNICTFDHQTALLKNQLTTILDDTFSQYVNGTFKNVHNAIVAEISEILYNELAFFKLMNDVDNIDCDNN